MENKMDHEMETWGIWRLPLVSWEWRSEEENGNCCNGLGVRGLGGMEEENGNYNTVMGLEFRV